MVRKIHSDTSVVILAAGESKRMKRPKALLEFKKGITFIESIVQIYSSFSLRKLVIVTNKATLAAGKDVMNKLGKIAEVQINENLEYERFYSIQIGMSALSDMDFAFLQNVDNPFVNVTLLDKLYSMRFREGYCVPVYKEMGGHPILLCNDIINKIITCPNKNCNLRNILNKFKRVDVETKDKTILININSVKDYYLYIMSK